MLEHLKHTFLHIKNGKKNKCYVISSIVETVDRQQQKEIKLLGQFQWMPHWLFCWKECYFYKQNTGVRI